MTEKETTTTTTTTAKTAFNYVNIFSPARYRSRKEPFTFDFPDF